LYYPYIQYPLGGTGKIRFEADFRFAKWSTTGSPGGKGDFSITLALFLAGRIPSAPQALSLEPKGRQRLFSLIALTFRVLKYLLIMLAYNLFLLFKMDRGMKTEYRQQV
jgi:hypothetical protein